MPPPLPAGWLDHKLVEMYCVEIAANGKKRLTTAAIDNPVIFLKFRKELYPGLTVSKYRGALRRLCINQGEGYHKSPLRSDLRMLLADRINELGKKAWQCFKEPTVEQQNQVDDSPALLTMLLVPDGATQSIPSSDGVADLDGGDPGSSSSSSIDNSAEIVNVGGAVEGEGERFFVGDFTALAASVASGFNSGSSHPAGKEAS